MLAAGEGTRLQALTRMTCGVSVPKQFCSVTGGESLLQEALRRAQAVASPVRTCAVVAEQHRRWWQDLALDIPRQNLISQPLNRGTANGILLPLLRIIERDSAATLLILPSDHYVRDEEILTASLQSAMAELQQRSNHLVLLGITPDGADPELGYIVPDEQDAGLIRDVREFSEKPSAAAALELIERGGLWNSFILAAHAQTLLRAFEERYGELVTEMRHALGSCGEGEAHNVALAELYERLPQLDFSRDVLQRSPQLLKVLTVPPCGWSDLGTPRRVLEVMARHARPETPATAAPSILAFLDLAHRRTGLSAAG
ncbi:MAG: sugar phosphate nucleotidyltransferase [Steroidobacteraceae bacterium]